MTDEQKPSGIKSFSVGFGATPAAGQAREVRPAPAYRILIAGDFGIEEGEHDFVGGRDLAELIESFAPALDVTAPNVLGSHPTRVEERVSLRSLADLRPANLLKQFGHHRNAVAALERADREAFAGQRYDRLTPVLPFATHAATGSSRAAIEPDGDDGLDGLFDMIETSIAKQRPASNTLAGFIADNVLGERRDRKSPAAPNDATTALLDTQALALLSEPRLRQVIENWHGLRVVIDAIGQERGVEIMLLQVSIGAGPEGVNENLEHALNHELFDLMLFANRCSAAADGAATLNLIAETADTFDIAALATLTPDFARMPAEKLAALDTPHQAVEAPGFEAFNGLRGQARAERLGVFWNDACVAEGSAWAPDYFVPAAWIAAALALRNVAGSGWPDLRAANRNELGGFAVRELLLGGRPVAVATRAPVIDEAAGGLAGIGISALGARRDRDSIKLLHTPLFAAARSDTLFMPKLNDRLVMARISQFLQAVLPDVLRDPGGPVEKAGILQERLTELVEGMPSPPRFSVAAATDEEEGATLDITVSLPEGVAAQSRYELQIPC